MKMRRVSRFAKKVYRAIHPEFKKKTDETDGSMGIYDSAPFYQCLNILAQGNQYYQRVGNKINVKSIYVRVTVNMITENTLDYNFYRVLIVRNKFAENSGTCPIADILDFNSSGGNHMNAFRYIPYLKNFKVIKDTYCRTLGKVGGLKKTHTWNWYIKQNIVCTYNQAENLATDISLNSYWLIAYASEGANYPEIQVDYSLSYLDC